MATVEDRLNTLETELATIKLQLSQIERSGSWLDEVSGSFRDQPEFDEILRLGHEFRRYSDATSNDVL